MGVPYLKKKMDEVGLIQQKKSNGPRWSKVLLDFINNSWICSSRMWLDSQILRLFTWIQLAGGYPLDLGPFVVEPRCLPAYLPGFFK